MGKKPTGGRGHKNLYDSTHVRIPEPIKPLVESLADDYRRVVSECKCLDFDSKGLLPKVPAIYFVLEDEEIVYIGQTKNLLQRWQNHHIIAKLGVTNKISIAWLQSQNIELLKVIESTLIATVQPRLNNPTEEKFTTKYEEPKRLHTFRLTNTANVWLENMAIQCQCSKTDIIEMYCRGELKKKIILTAIDQYINSQLTQSGGNQHRKKGEVANIENSRDWKRLRQFKEWIERNN